MAFLFPKLFPPYIGCLPETANGQLEMPLEDAMALVWKAKTLKFTASFSATGVSEVGVSTNTLNADTNPYICYDLDQPFNPPPLEKMTDIICQQSVRYATPDGTNFFSANDRFGGEFRGNYIGVPDNTSCDWEFSDFNFGPLSVKTVGQNKVCDFACVLFLDPRFVNVEQLFGTFSVTTGGPYPPQVQEGGIFTSVPNGVVVMVNGNSYFTDLYFTTRGPEPDITPTFTSLIATGQILIEIESERLAE